MNRDKLSKDGEAATIYCEQLAQNYLGFDMAMKAPKVSLSGGGGAYGYETTVVSWNDPNIKCTVKRITDLGETQLVNFEFDEKNLTGLMKREERN